MNFDYLNETKKLITMLQVENMDNFASTLQAVLSSASNSTELLMGLKFHLDEILVSKVSYAIRVQSEMMIKEINAILER